MAWKRQLTLEALNATSENTMVAHRGLSTPDWKKGCWRRVCRLMRVRINRLVCTRRLAALAETLGSMAGWLMTEEGQCVVGTELNATHHRAVSSGRARRVSPSAPRASEPELGDCGV